MICWSIQVQSRSRSDSGNRPAARNAWFADAKVEVNVIDPVKYGARSWKFGADEGSMVKRKPSALRIICVFTAFYPDPRVSTDLKTSSIACGSAGGSYFVPYHG